MRKISHWDLDHNLARYLMFAMAGVLLAAISAGCQAQQNKHAEQASGPSTTECQVTVNSQPWPVFESMATRMSQGQMVPQAELKAYGEIPMVEAWRRSLAPNVPRAQALANWLQDPWRLELGLPRSHKNTSNRWVMSHNYLYCLDHAAAIDSLLQQYTTGTAACQTANLAGKWLSPANIPHPLVLNFLPALAEIRMFEDQVYVDTGVLMAGGVAQTSRSIATLLYRSLEAIPGTNPLAATGEQAVAECLRIMTNEGVAGWIEQTTSVYFSPDHPSLHKIQIIPTDFYRKAQQTTQRLAEYLPPMFADPAVMADRGNNFARELAGGNSFSQTGIAMAELIAGRLGEERLHQVRGSVSEFWAAFQEAALLNETPLPPIGAPGVPLYKSLAPLPDSLYEPLQALLLRHF